MPAHYLELLVPDDRLLLAIAEEASINDADLDALEAELLAEERSPLEMAALALVLGRAGRADSRDALERARDRLPAAQAPRERAVLELALELLEASPGRGVERAERGYRRRTGELELYVEDLLAAHWHAKGRWGPPLRVERRQSPLLIQGPGQVERVQAHLREGGLALVTFAHHGLLRRPAPPLRLARAGLSFDPSLRALVRWSHVRSVGSAEQGGRRRAAFEVRGEPLSILSGEPSLPTAELVELLGRLLADARG